MEYKYLLEERVNNNITFNDIVNEVAYVLPELFFGNRRGIKYS